MRTIVALAVLFASFAALADDVQISPKDCQQLVHHVPSAGVEYTPGVDVHGKSVAPADVGGSYQLDLPQSIDIQIGVDLADRLGLRDAKKQGTATPARRAMPFSGYAPLGTLSIKGNDAYWNGNRMTPQDEAVLSEACRQGLSKAGILPVEKPAIPR